MSDMGGRIQREIRKQKWIKKQKAKNQEQPKTNLSSVQFETNLSRMYDNDGNPRSLPVTWHKETFEGH